MNTEMMKLANPICMRLPQPRPLPHRPLPIQDQLDPVMNVIKWGILLRTAGIAQLIKGEVGVEVDIEAEVGVEVEVMEEVELREI